MADEQQVPQGIAGGQQVISSIDMQQLSQPAGQSSEYNQIAAMVSDLDRRLRVLEERYSILRKKLQLTDQNLVDSERSFSRELHSFGDSLIELKRNSSDFSDKILLFATELENTASRSDLKVIEKYLALWSPEMFITRKELKEYLEKRREGD